MPATLVPKYLLPAEAYFSRDWFEEEQATVGARSWHRGDRGAETAVWEGMTFFSDRPSMSLDQALYPIPESIGSFRPSRLAPIASVDLDGHFNWKLFVENHVDVLHLWYLHDETLAEFDHSQFSHQQGGMNWTSYEPSRYPERTEHRTPIQHLDDRDRFGLGAHLLFPDTPMAAGAEFFATYRARPVAPDRTTIELRVHAEPSADPEPIVAEIRAFIEEDMEACERIQQVVESRHFEVGPLARVHESPIAVFQQNVLGLMAERS